MRVKLVVIMLVTSYLSTLGVAQQPQHDTQLGNPVSIRQVLELPSRDAFPQINLQQALRIAERFIRKQKIDMKSYYLFEAKLSPGPRPEESTWRFWWVNVPGKAISDDVRITVTMKGKAQASLAGDERSLGAPR
jgi:hypothetical protein